MQPTNEDMHEGHHIIGAIMEHRIAFLKGKANELPTEEFFKLWMHRQNWIWPKASNNIGHLDQARYSPSPLTNNEKYNTSNLWESFATTLHSTPDDGNFTSGRLRLPVFKAMLEKVEVADTADIPRMKRVSPVSIIDFPMIPLEEATWRELILGEGGIGGRWNQAIESYISKM